MASWGGSLSAQGMLQWGKDLSEKLTLAEVRELIHGESIELLNVSHGLRAENSRDSPHVRRNYFWY